MKITTLKQLENEQKAINLLEDFYKYKKLHDVQDLPVVSQADQLVYESMHATFGRDKLFERPQEAKYASLYHAHFSLFNNKKWFDPKGNPKVQWNCTSNRHLVYSVINPDDHDHHFHIHAILEMGAHQLYRQHGLVKAWINEANGIRSGLYVPKDITPSFRK